MDGDPAHRLTGDGSAGASGGYEACVELYYLAQLTPCLYVQPGIEWIGHPGGGDEAPLDNAVVGYSVVGVEF
ncbi:MAG: carbohydrate porin [Phycisphaerales bacterium]|nr:carbohydrate porin [Phycisphaerales bacterium]